MTPRRDRQVDRRRRAHLEPRPRSPAPDGGSHPFFEIVPSLAPDGRAAADARLRRAQHAAVLHGRLRPTPTNSALGGRPSRSRRRGRAPTATSSTPTSSVNAARQPVRQSRSGLRAGRRQLPVDLQNAVTHEFGHLHRPRPHLLGPVQRPRAAGRRHGRRASRCATRAPDAVKADGDVRDHRRATARLPKRDPVARRHPGVCAIYPAAAGSAHVRAGHARRRLRLRTGGPARASGRRCYRARLVRRGGVAADAGLTPAHAVARLRAFELDPQIADRRLAQVRSWRAPPAPARRCGKPVADDGQPPVAGDEAQQPKRAVALDVGASPSRRPGPIASSAAARDRRAGRLRLHLAGDAARERHGQVRELAGRRGVDAGRVVGVLDLQAHVAGRQRRDREVAADVGDAAGDRRRARRRRRFNAPPARPSRRARASGRPPSSRTSPSSVASARTSLISQRGR